MHSSVSLILLVMFGCAVCPPPLDHQIGDGLTAAAKLSGFSGNYGLGGGLGGLTLNDMGYDLIGSFSMASRSVGVKLGLPLPETSAHIPAPELSAIPSAEAPLLSPDQYSSPELSSVASPELTSLSLVKPELDSIPTSEVDIYPKPELKSLSLTKPELTPIPTSIVNLIPPTPELSPFKVLSPNLESVHLGPLTAPLTSYSTPTQSVKTEGYHWRKPMGYFRSFFHMGHPKDVLNMASTKSSVIPISEPITHSIAEPISHAIAEPVSHTISKPIVHTIAEPVSHAINKPIVHTIVEPIPEPEVYKKPQLDYKTVSMGIGDRLHSKLSHNPNFFTVKYNHWVSPHQKVSGYTSKVNHVSKYGYGESSMTFSQLHGLPSKKLSWDKYDVSDVVEPIEHSAHTYKPLVLESPHSYESALIGKREDLIGYGSQLTGSFGSILTNGYNKWDYFSGGGLKGLEFPWKKKK